MAEVNVSVAEFRQRFPIFSSTTKYPDTLVQTMLDTAIIYIPNRTTCCKDEKTVKEMIYLMTAHLLATSTDTASGGTGGVVQSASVGGVSVSKMAPPAKNMFSYWLAGTPYGLQLLAMLKMQSTIGVYVGGTKENVFR